MVSPGFILLSLATFVAIFVLGAFMLAFGWVIPGALTAMASIPLAVLVELVGEHRMTAGEG
jgi:hypothetical protein